MDRVITQSQIEANRDTLIERTTNANGASANRSIPKTIEEIDVNIKRVMLIAKDHVNEKDIVRFYAQRYLPKGRRDFITESYKSADFTKATEKTLNVLKGLKRGLHLGVLEYRIAHPKASRELIEKFFNKPASTISRIDTETGHLFIDLLLGYDGTNSKLGRELRMKQYKQEKEDRAIKTIAAQMARQEEQSRIYASFRNYPGQSAPKSSQSTKSTSQSKTLTK